MNIEINHEAVFKDDECVGTMGLDFKFHPDKGLPHKTVASIEKWLSKQKMKLEVDDQVVLKGGKPVGTVDDEGFFVPKKGLHHKTLASVEREIAKGALETKGDTPREPEKFIKKQGGEAVTRLVHTQEIVGSNPTPATSEPPRTHLGDIAPDMVEWRRANWPKIKFDNLYPMHRLRQLGML